MTISEQVQNDYTVAIIRNWQVLIWGSVLFIRKVGPHGASVILGELVQPSGDLA